MSKLPLFFKLWFGFCGLAGLASAAFGVWIILRLMHHIGA